MNSVTINTISLSPDYQIYICDIYGNNCVFTAIIPLNVPPSITLSLPSIYSNASSVGVKIINNGNCEKFEVLLCDTLIPTRTTTPTVTITPTNTPTINNPTNTPTPTPTPTTTVAPVMCFNMLNQNIGSNYSCSLSPLGILNGKPYYGILFFDCLTSSNSFVVWNPTTSRWEHIGSGGVLIAYNLNPNYYPYTDGTYSWFNVFVTAIPFRILTSTSSVCPSQTPTSTPTPTRTPNFSILINSVKGTIDCIGRYTLIATSSFNFYINSTSTFCTSCTVQIFSNSSLTTPINTVTSFIVNTNQIWICNNLGFATYFASLSDAC